MENLNLIDDLINGFDQLIEDFKIVLGASIKNEILLLFERDGYTDVVGGIEYDQIWKPLAPSTIKKKKSSAILRHYLWLISTITYRIEDGKVLVGWFEDSGGYNEGDRYLSTPHVAAIHEFGLTGLKFNTASGHEMGGDKIQGQYGEIEIPERSMLRKVFDIVKDTIDIEFTNFFNNKFNLI